MDQHANPVRKIIHIDADAFFASVEQRDDPSLRGRPVAVGSSKERGVVAAASYEARKFGVRSAMPSLTALNRCPHLVFVKPRFEVYRAVSTQMREIFQEYTPLVEPLSLDEAYLDVTVNHRNMTIATEIAEEIRAKVRATTGLTVSAGVSYCKFLAKMASDERKPDGLFVITPKNGALYMETLKIEKFHGVGPATAEKMRGLGIKNGADLRTKPLEFLKDHFGKSGQYFHDLARGIDNRAVNPERTRKSVGAEETFEVDLIEYADAEAAIITVADDVWKRCDKHGTRGRTLTIKVKYADFEQITRSRSVSDFISDVGQFRAMSTSLLKALFPVDKGIRLLGVSLSKLEGDDHEHSQEDLPQLAFDL